MSGVIVTENAVIQVIEASVQGPAGSSAVPAGGTTGQPLVKQSDSDLDANWDSTVSLDSVLFNTSAVTDPVQGQIGWNSEDHTLDLGLNGDVVLQLGQEMHYLVRNGTASPITSGQVVMATGTVGASGRIVVGLAVGDGSVPGKYTMGVATETIAAGADGYVTAFGKVRGVDTRGWDEGDILYLDPAVPGGLTNVVPTAPSSHVTVAIVISSFSNGTIFVRPTYGSNFTENDDVVVTNPQVGEVLVYNGSVWVNKAVTADMDKVGV